MRRRFVAQSSSFILLPKSDLDGLRKAAVPKEGEDTFHDYFDEHGSVAAEYDFSGYLLATLLPYLDEQHGIDLTRSEYDELGEFLSRERQASYCIFTDEHKKLYCDRLLEEPFSPEELCEYFNKFNEVEETELGEPMEDGIRAIQESLERVDADSVIIFSIG